MIAQILGLAIILAAVTAYAVPVDRFPRTAGFVWALSFCGSTWLMGYLSGS